MPGQGGMLLPGYAAYTIASWRGRKIKSLPTSASFGNRGWATKKSGRRAKKSGGCSEPRQLSPPSLGAAARNMERGRERYSLRKGEIFPESRAGGAGPPPPHPPRRPICPHSLQQAAATAGRERIQKKFNKTKKGQVLEAQKWFSHIPPPPLPPGAQPLPPEHLEILNGERAAANFGW